MAKATPGIKVCEAESVGRIVEDLYNDRVGFAKHIVGMTPTDQQAEAMAALDTNDSVAGRSGHGVGKSAAEAILIIQYMSTRAFCKIPCTAPTKHQLYDVLWSELSKWHTHMMKNSAGELFGSMFQWTKERFFHKGDQEKERWFAVARTANKDKPEGLQGFHADYVLRIVDEASAVDDSVHETMEGNTGIYETKEFLAGNPTRNDGNFFDAFYKARGLYKTFTWSCLDSPIAPKKFIDKIVARYGVDSQVYVIRVLGKHFLGEGDSYIPYHLAYEATYRDVPLDKTAPIVMGVDVARYGDDDTVIAIRQGDIFFPLHVFSKKSTMETVGHIRILARHFKPAQIFVDEIGLGAGVKDRLEELGYPVTGVNVAEAPAQDGQQFVRLRDELWGNMRVWLESRRGKLSDNEDLDLVSELTTPKFKITSDGKIKIESKDELKRRQKASPNRADACLMTFAQPIWDFATQDDFFTDLYGGQDNYRPLDPESGY
jgi:hypothetical protein